MLLAKYGRPSYKLYAVGTFLCMLYRTNRRAEPICRDCLWPMSWPEAGGRHYKPR